jgi:hypothetical protein
MRRAALTLAAAAGGGKRVLENLETTVTDGTLIFDPQDEGLNDDHELDVTITVPRATRPRGQWRRIDPSHRVPGQPHLALR